MADYVTADSHFWHRNIIRYTGRPFEVTTQGVEEMNEMMGDMIASTCKSGDTLYHLGDVYFGGKEKGEDVALQLSRSASRKILVIGNHDNLKSWPDILLGCFDQILDAKIVHIPRMEIFMSHRPLMIDEFWRGDIVNLHGHVHGITPNPPGRLDVGVDPAWRYFGIPRPFELTEAVRMALEDLPATHFVKGEGA